MAQFSALYGSDLDTELGSDQRTLFTLVRRKAAINEGIREFARLTGCWVKEGTIPLVDGTGEYDLGVAFADFVRLDTPDPSITITTAAGAITTLSGDSLPRKDLAELDRYDVGWRSVSASTPSCWYERKSGGITYLGLTPAPDIPVGDTWAARVNYAALPADLVADTDEPFSVSGDPLVALRPYHRAAVHYAASQLEKLRRDWDAVKLQQTFFSALVDQYKADQRPRGGQRVRFARDYRRERRGGWSGVALDPRR